MLAKVGPKGEPIETPQDSPLGEKIVLVHESSISCVRNRLSLMPDRMECSRSRDLNLRSWR